MIKTMHELLEEASAQPSEAERVKYLQTKTNPVLQRYIELALHPDIKFALRPGPFAYKPSNFPDTHGKLYMEVRRMYLFLEGGHPTLSPEKRESLFVEILESCEPKDAELLLAIKDKKLPYKGITYSVVQKAFPGLLPDKVKTGTIKKTKENADAQ